MAGKGKGGKMTGKGKGKGNVAMRKRTTAKK